MISLPNVRAHPQPGLLLMIIEPKPIRGGNGQNRGRDRLSGGAVVMSSVIILQFQANHNKHN